MSLLSLRKPSEQRGRFERAALPHLDALYGTAMRLCHNDKDAEDLVQDTLLRAFQSFAQFSGEERIRPWLFKILTNTFINKYRRRVLERNVAAAMAREQDASAVSQDLVHRARAPEEVLQQTLLSDDV